MRDLGQGPWLDAVTRRLRASTGTKGKQASDTLCSTALAAPQTLDPTPVATLVAPAARPHAGG